MSISDGLLPFILFNLFNITPSLLLSSKCKGLVRVVVLFLENGISVADQTISQAKAFTAKKGQNEFASSC